MPKFILFALVVISCAVASLSAQSPEQKSKPILFHVTSVDRVDNVTGCKAGECSIVRYKVEGYADTDRDANSTSYSIACDELFYDRPRPHRNNICARFHAGSAYKAQLMADSIAFPFSGLNKAFETDYRIVSEKELPANAFPHGPQGNSEPKEATKAPLQSDTAKPVEQLASSKTH